MNVGAGRLALVTGAAGFAGRHLIRELEREHGWSVIGLSRHAEQLSDRTRSIACDLLDKALVRRVLERHRPDAIYHLAAQSYVPKAVADPGPTLTNNIIGHVNLLEGCLAAGLRPRILVVSSSEIYGPPEAGDLPVREDHALKPVNPYAVSKATQDLLGYQYFVSAELDIVRARPFNHCGPGQSDRFVVSGFARQIAEAERGRVEPTILVGNLDVQRDFLDVRDVVRAYRMLVNDGVGGVAYNIASGVPRRIGSLLEQLVALARIDLDVRADRARARASDLPLVYGDAGRLRETTGWEPEIAIEASLEDTLNYWRNA